MVVFVTTSENLGNYWAQLIEPLADLLVSPYIGPIISLTKYFQSMVKDEKHPSRISRSRHNGRCKYHLLSRVFTENTFETPNALFSLCHYPFPPFHIIILHNLSSPSSPLSLPLALILSLSLIELSPLSLCSPASDPERQFSWYNRQTDLVLVSVCCIIIFSPIKALLVTFMWVSGEWFVSIIKFLFFCKFIIKIQASCRLQWA